jgi:transporter family protein
MPAWFWYAIFAALLYGLHQVFTKLASDHIGDGLGGFVVEATAAATIAFYLIYLRFFGKWDQASTGRGVFFSVLTGLCVGAGTVIFFLLFQKGGPLSAVPMVLAGGASSGLPLNFRGPFASQQTFSYGISQTLELGGK